MEINTIPKWEKFDYNEVLKGKGFYISYNPQTGKTDLGNLYNLMGNALGKMVGKEVEADGRAETALCKDGEFYILNGDFRKQYEKLITKGFMECKKFYDSKPDLHSGWSSME